MGDTEIFHCVCMCSAIKIAPESGVLGRMIAHSSPTYRVPISPARQNVSLMVRATALARPRDRRRVEGLSLESQCPKINCRVPVSDPRKTTIIDHNEYDWCICYRFIHSPFRARSRMEFSNVNTLSIVYDPINISTLCFESGHVSRLFDDARWRMIRQAEGSPLSRERAWGADRSLGFLFGPRAGRVCFRRSHACRSSTTGGLSRSRV